MLSLPGKNKSEEKKGYDRAIWRLLLGHSTQNLTIDGAVKIKIFFGGGGKDREKNDPKI